MTHSIPYVAAIDEAIREEMERDPSVLYFGQNIAHSTRGSVPQAVRS